MNDLHSTLVAQRLALCDTLDTITDDQWEVPSLCVGWSVREVVAHLVFPATASKLKAVFALARNGFSFDKMTTALVRAEHATGPELAAKFRATATHRWTPPGFGFEAPVTDTVAHGSDICRPLGLVNPIDPGAARVVLDFLVTAKATRVFLPRGRIDGLKFAATDLNWSFGAGQEVAGPSEPLICSILGREVAYDELHGPGLAILRDRSAARPE